MRAATALVAAAVRFELRLWRNLWRWLRRRPPRLAPGEEGFGYVRAITPALRIFIVISVVELPIFHLIVPWPTVRLLVDLAGVYGLFWMVGLLATTHQEPHVVAPDGLRLRYGMLGRLHVPWADVAQVRVRDRTLPPGTVLVEAEGDRLVAHVAVVQQTNVDLVFRRPVVLGLRKAGGRAVHELRCYADEPQALVAAARDRLAAAEQHMSPQASALPEH